MKKFTEDAIKFKMDDSMWIHRQIEILTVRVFICLVIWMLVYM
jgi:hypothetical protein